MKPGRNVSKPFDDPVAVKLGSRVFTVGSVEQAYDLLTDLDWPERGPRHRDASETCLKVIDGHRSTVEARREFVAAAREAGVLQQE